jgi:Tol biopolymer transport system component
LTFGDVPYVHPDVDQAGRLVATRIRIQSDVWRFPVSGSPAENARAGVRITHQTGLAQTPSVGPDDKELVYLSDSGGHGNLWVAKTDGSGVRQITFERDPAVSIGVPVWSPTDNHIAFLMTRDGSASQWLINADGSGLQKWIPGSFWAYWSPDGRSLYYTVGRDGRFCIEKASLAGGASISIRCDGAAPAVSPDELTLYFLAPLNRQGGQFDWEVRRARPEGGAGQPLARIAGARVPTDPLNLHTIVSPDGKWLAMPLTDGGTSNLWLLPSEGGAMRPVTDFGTRPLVIARRISWSPDGRFLYAAVADTDADIVLLDGMIR